MSVKKFHCQKYLIPTYGKEQKRSVKQIDCQKRPSSDIWKTARKVGETD